uniref:MARVEL domain-containing protein n=1 Tax=Panagrolaimus sp. PS1159 TaxID=55785 RepID=A0AC35FDB0_9BILA
MAPKSHFCGFNITTCAIFVAISGICSTISAVTIAIFSEQYFDSYPIWFYIGIGILTVIIYFLVFIGIAKQSYGYLIPAEILLGIKIILAFIFIIWFILCGLYLPETIFKEFKIISLFNDVRIAIRNVFFTISAMSFLYLNFVVYSFFVIQSARQWLASNSQNKNTSGAENAEALFNKRRRSLSPIFPETGKYTGNDSGILCKYL